MFIAALFIVTKICKQPKCPSTGEWIKKMYIYITMEYYLAIKEEIFAICNNMGELRGYYA